MLELRSALRSISAIRACLRYNDALIIFLELSDNSVKSLIHKLLLLYAIDPETMKSVVKQIIRCYRSREDEVACNGGCCCCDRIITARSAPRNNKESLSFLLSLSGPSSRQGDESLANEPEKPQSRLEEIRTRVQSIDSISHQQREILGTKRSKSFRDSISGSRAAKNEHRTSEAGPSGML
ncbi:hypothetical protein ACA910_009801 [Epithemia clementina (nom. ined.)]